jgi:hypothetical protein
MSSSTEDRRARLERARQAVRVVERWCYRQVADAETPDQEREAQDELRLAVGLRRKLDKEE